MPSVAVVHGSTQHQPEGSREFEVRELRTKKKSRVTVSKWNFFGSCQKAKSISRAQRLKVLQDFLEHDRGVVEDAQPSPLDSVEQEQQS